MFGWKKRRTEKRESWLSKNFCDVAFKTQEDGAVEASLPYIYDLEYDKVEPKEGAEALVFFLPEFLTDVLMLEHVYFIPKKMAALGRDKSEAVNNIYKTLLKMAKENDGEVCRLVLKDGQSLEQLQNGKSYEMIYREDERHDHDSNDLLDFERLKINKRNKSVSTLEHMPHHSHLWIGNNSPAL